jgi:hypothetical protein
MAGIQDFIAMATSKLGVGKDAASGATGGVAALIQKAVSAADWGKLAAAVPGLGDLAAKAGAGGGGGGGGGLGGVLGGLAQKAGGLLGGGGSALAAATAAGIPADKAPSFLKMLADFLQSKVPAFSDVIGKVPGLGKSIGA